MSLRACGHFGVEVSLCFTRFAFEETACNNNFADIVFHLRGFSLSSSCRTVEFPYIYHTRGVDGVLNGSVYTMIKQGKPDLSDIMNYHPAFLYTALAR